MRRLGIFVGVLLLLAVTVPVFAQGGMFADVPTDHWAYKAVNDLQEKGFIIGYPDGTFGGKRAMTRYEFAMAISRLWQEVSKLGPGTPGEPGKPGEPGAPGAPGITPEELNQIKRMAEEFRNELATLGTDVDQLKKDVKALTDRVAAVEEELNRVKVNLRGDMMFRGTAVKRGDAQKNPVDIDGRPMTANKISPNNLLNSAQVLWDYDLTIKGRVAERTNATVVINASTYLPAIGSISSIGGAGLGGYIPPQVGLTAGRSRQAGGAGTWPGAGRTEVTPWYFYVDHDLDLSFVGESHIVVGQFPLQLTPYTFKLVDVDYYNKLPKTDDGDFPVTGIKATKQFGPVGLTVFAVQHVRTPFVDMPGTAIGTSNQIGSRPWDQSAGVRATWDTGSFGQLGLNYIQAGLSNISINGSPTINKAEVYGADYKSKYMDERLGVDVSWTQSDYRSGSNNVNINTGLVSPNGTPIVVSSNNENTALDAQITYNFGGLVVGGGYRDIEPNFYAPGYWHRIGPVKNPVNIKGGRGILGYKLSDTLDLNASYEDLQESLDTSLDARIQRITAEANYKLYGGSYILLAYENVQLESTQGRTSRGDTAELNYFDVGYGHAFNDNLNLRFYYQYVDAKDKTPGGNGSFKGNIAGTQLTVKF